MELAGVECVRQDGEDKWLEVLSAENMVENPSFKCKDNIKMNIKETSWEDVHWIYMDQNRDALIIFCVTKWSQKISVISHLLKNNLFFRIS